MMPQLEILSERESQQPKSTQERAPGIGLSQAFEFGQHFNKECVMIISRLVYCSMPEG